MKVIEETIEQYLNPDRTTDYAVMITGEWGLGKTYFLKNKLQQIIKTIKIRKTKNQFSFNLPKNLTLSGK